MNDQKLRGMIGLAVRARQTAAGTDACRILIRCGECGVLLIDSGTADNTRKKAEEMCERTGTPWRVLPEGLIEAATGKSNMILGLRKGSFAEQVLKESVNKD
ncbi:MAG: hypothetical protein IKZ98_11250 [Clostridia bacterium]|nr:hypothetical protein [Clostridia bacterium]